MYMSGSKVNGTIQSWKKQIVKYFKSLNWFELHSLSFEILYYIQDYSSKHRVISGATYHSDVTIQTTHNSFPNNLEQVYLAQREGLRAAPFLRINSHVRLLHQRQNPAQQPLRALQPPQHHVCHRLRLEGPVKLLSLNPDHLLVDELPCATE